MFSPFAEGVIETAALLTAAGVIGRVVWKLFRKLSDAYQWLHEIHEELTPNGGRSISDIIKRIDRNDATLHRNINTVYSVVLSLHSLDPVVDAPPLEVLEAFDPGPLPKGPS